MQKIIRIFMKTIRYILLFSIVSIFASLVWRFLPPLTTYNYVQCSNKYPLRDTYMSLSKTHKWKIYDNPFLELESYLNNTRDGILVDTNVNQTTKETSTSITNVKHNKWYGFSLGYLNGELSSIYYYRGGLREGLHLTFTNKYPSMVVIYSNNKNKGIVAFWDYGKIRGTKFDNGDFKKSKDTYENGQKAFEYLEENGTKYWVVYNPDGKMLVKYPTDNDFCKAKFYEEGKEVKIPYYFDHQEFEEIYAKIKHDIATGK